MENLGPIMELQNVSLKLGGHWQLRDISLSITPGDSLAILGGSGCGKTLTLKLLVGLLDPSLGESRIHGKNWHKLSQSEVRQQRRKIGFLFQGAALFDSLSARENVAYPLISNTKLNSNEVGEKVSNLLKEVNLPETNWDKLPAELSGGQRKRVGLARALALDPDILCYDEPTTGLDPITIARINDLIKRTSEQRHVTTIIVTHEMKTVFETAQRALMLQPLAGLPVTESQILFNGSVSELEQASDERVRAFVTGSILKNPSPLRGEP